MRWLLLVVVAILSSCTRGQRRVPHAQLEFAKADYEVLGKTEHEACGTYIFAIDWAHLFNNEKTRIPGNLATKNREESRALYYALEKMPEATHLMAHRSRTTATGLLLGTYPIFGERCAAVQARGVRLADRPAIYALDAVLTERSDASDDLPDDPRAVVPPAPMR